MSIIIKIENNAAGFPCPFAGEYIMDYDPYFGGTTDRGKGLLGTTKDPAKAKEFDDLLVALDYWKQVSPTVPVRDLDGQPNRPLTAFTVSLEASPNSTTDEEVEVEIRI